MKKTRFGFCGQVLLYLPLILALCCPANAQTIQPTILQIDLENKVQYREDSSLDPSKFATNPGIVPATPPKDFGQFVSVADIVAVNGQPAKGVALYRARTVNLTPTPAPGNAISDVVRNGAIDQMFEILSGDGTTPIGTILASGLAAGPAPPGSPLDAVQGNLAIFGGTGAFLGARGQVSQGPTTVPDRSASMTEDPSKRRINGGGKVRILLSVIPAELPQIVVGAGFPRVLHSRDSSDVTIWNPAEAGEVLHLFVTGLGPTRPAVNPGQPFPVSPAAVVNSPVSVTINGKSATVLSAIGFPGVVDGYQVDVQVPSDAPRGIATVQLTAAWIQGPAVGLPIQ